MVRPGTAAVWILALLAASCVSDPKPTVSVFWVPALTVQADVDDAEPGGDVWFDADLHTGSGWAVRAGLHEDGAGLGILYMTTSHGEKSADTHARTHAAYLEFYLPTDRTLDPPFFFAGLAGGVGAAIFDFDDAFDDTGGAAGMLRGEVGFRPVDHFSILVSGGGFLWGYPTETMGYGGFIMLGLGADF